MNLSRLPFDKAFSGDKCVCATHVLRYWLPVSEMETTSYVTFALLILGVGVTFVVSLIEPIQLPTEFSSCIEYRTSHYNASHTPLHMIQAFCMNKFLSLNPANRIKVNFTLDETNYISSLFRQVFEESFQTNAHGRFRRQAIIQRNHRREIRAAPYTHWQRYVAAVNRLKRDWRGNNGRSRYDTLAAIHTAAVDDVHFGPAFLPWHRMYLILFETALGVPIPYWDPTIDSEMEDPTSSIVWTDKYFGNGKGLVTTGPFRFSDTPTGQLVRDIGTEGMLFSKSNLQRILQRHFNSEIFEPAVDQMSTLEGQHNLVHFWVGGQMNEFEIASYDPMFWNFHAFVDFIWEIFRRQQYRRGINPANDVVESVDWRQDPDNRASGLLDLTYRDGYSSRFAGRVTYDPLPRCPNCGNSPDMYCDWSRRACVSVGGVYGMSRTSTSPLLLANVFNRRNARVFFRRRGKRSISTVSNNLPAIPISDKNIDISNYIFVGVKIIRTDDVESQLRHFLNATNTVAQIVNPSCSNYESLARDDVIYVKADGLNYIGRYKDSAKVHSTGIVYVGIQRPTNLASDAYISAFDKCGRICVPNCLVRNTHPPVYRTCTGAVRATMKEPMMFLSFDFTSENNFSKTSLNNNLVPVVFHCGL